VKQENGEDKEEEVLGTKGVEDMGDEVCWSCLNLCIASYDEEE
jgi:hypothetical protein